MVQAKRNKVNFTFDVGVVIEKPVKFNVGLVRRFRRDKLKEKEFAKTFFSYF